MSFSEAELQKKLTELVKNETLIDSIEGIEDLKKSADKEKSIYIPRFLIDFKLHHRYIKSALSVLESLGIYDHISGEKIKNISLNTTEKLYPDYLLNNPEGGQVILWELKKDRQTEREAVTELLAYAHEIKNHLPLISDSDIKLVIVSTEFNTLLEHAISMVLLGTAFDILCLKSEIKNQKLTLKVHKPKAWTDIWQNSIPEDSISTVTLVLETKEKKEIDINWLRQIYNTSTDLISKEGSKVNSNGFCIFWANSFDTDLSVPFGITICQINPYAFLHKSLEKGFKHNINSPLAQYILKNSSEFSSYHHPQSMFDIVKPAKKFLKQYFETSYEGFSNWGDDMFTKNYFRSQARPIIIESWGDVGDYFRFFYLRNLNLAGYFRNELKFEKAYKEPYVALQMVHILTGKTHFDNGIFNSSSIYKFLQQLTAYSHYCKICLDAENKNEIASTRLFYLSTELIGAMKEIEYRIGSMTNRPNTVPMFPIFSGEVTHDIDKEINDFLTWFCRDFISKDNRFYYLLFPDLLKWAQYFEEDPILKKALKKEDKLSVENKIGEFIKTYCQALIKEAFFEKARSYQFDLREYLNEMLDIEIDEENKSENEIRTEIENLSNSNLVSVFESKFLKLLDWTVDEIFHEIVDLDFSTLDWPHFKEKLIERHKEGFKYTMVQISNNGELAIGNLPEEKRFMGEIDDPEKEVFVEINFSGIALVIRCSWEDVFSGKAFEPLKKKES